MLDYLISLLDFTIGGTTYNLLTTPWEKIIAWVNTYQSSSQSYSYSTAVRDAWVDLGKIAVADIALVVVLIIICTWLFYKIAHGFSGWMKFR